MPIHNKSVLRQADGGPGKITNAHRAIESQRFEESGYAARHPCSKRAVEAFVGDVSRAVKIHRAARGSGSLLAKIDDCGGPVPLADEHESAAADISRLRIDDRERKPDRDGCVDRIPPSPQDVDTH